MQETRLIKSPSKLAIKCERLGIESVAASTGIGYLECETRYTNTRSALAHLLRHDRFRTHVYDRAREIVVRTQELLAQPGIERLSSDPNWTNRLAQAAHELEEGRKNELKQWAVSLEDITLFLDIIERTRAEYLARRFDPSEIITPELFVLASMARAHFDTYAKTLNT